MVYFAQGKASSSTLYHILMKNIRVLSALVVSVFLLVLITACDSSTNPLIPEENGQTFIGQLPHAAKSKILWFCDYEDGTFVKWEDQGTGTYYAGGGIFITDEQNTDYGIVSNYTYSGNNASFASIDNAIQPGNSKAVRFMRWTDKAWNENGDYFPDEAYYSVFMRFPEEYDPTKDSGNDPNNDGGWWNVFQFKSDNNDGSQPVVLLDIYNDGSGMFFGLIVKDYQNDNSSNHTQEYSVQANPLLIEPNKWIHVEAYYKKSKDYSGRVIVWQNGVKIFEKENIRTVLPPGETAVWGIGNYTDYIGSGTEAGKAIIYFDDAIVSEVRVSQYLD